jgi:hypothetical protein
MAQQYIGTARLGTHQVKAYTTSAEIDTAISSGINKVRVVVTSAAYIKVGKTPVTATTSDVYMPADSPEYFTINPGEKVAAVQVSSGGNLHVTEVS